MAPGASLAHCLATGFVEPFTWVAALAFAAEGFLLEVAAATASTVVTAAMVAASVLTVGAVAGASLVHRPAAGTAGPFAWVVALVFAMEGRLLAVAVVAAATVIPLAIMALVGMVAAGMLVMFSQVAEAYSTWVVLPW